MNNQQDDKDPAKTQPENLKTQNISKRFWYLCANFKKITKIFNLLFVAIFYFDFFICWWPTLKTTPSLSQLHTNL